MKNNYIFQTKGNLVGEITLFYLHVNSFNVYVIGDISASAFNLHCDITNCNHWRRLHCICI